MKANKKPKRGPLPVISNNGKPIMATISTTSCRKCVFAEWGGKTIRELSLEQDILPEDTLEGTIQTGCAAGRFEVFEKNGTDLVYVEHDEMGYYLVKDKACVYFKHIDLCRDLLKTTTLDELKERVRVSLKIPYQVIIFLREGDSLEDLEQRLSELAVQDVKPKVVSVLDRTHSEVDLTPQIVNLFHTHYNFDIWRTQRVTAVDLLDGAAVDVCFDNTKDHKYFFYSLFEASKSIPASFSAEIHHSVNEDMKSFVLLEPNSEGIGKTVLKIAHKKYGGNSFEIDLKDKLIYYNDGVSLIRKVVDLCPSLSTS